MKTSPTISVTIVAHNEEENIENCLKSCLWADEIIVIDAESTDKTSYIAKKMKAKVFRIKNQPLMKINMNISFDKSQSDWIFSLDADEKITDGLREEIRKIIYSTEYAAYRIPRKNIIFGKWIKYAGWYPDYQIRLFQKGKGRFQEKNVHELLSVKGKIGTMKNDIEHQNYKSVSEFINKLNKYTDLEAEKLIKEKRKVSWRDSLIFPKEEFLSRFFAREGYKDGLHGLVLSLLTAFYWEVVFAKVWERKENFKDLTPDNFFIKVLKEFRRSSKEIRYWIYQSLIQENPVMQLYYKLRRKI